jgi:hypothetical protein
MGGLRDRPNLARRRFLRREEVLATSHEDFGEIAVARLRAAADRYPRDQALAALLAELRAGSEEFTQVVFITADPDSPSARALRQLAAGITAGGTRPGPASAGTRQQTPS